MKVVYIAGPFRGENAWIVAENIRRAEKLAFEVAQAGFVPLCPHTMTSNFDGTFTDKYWLDATAELLRRCDAVLFTAKWEESEGAKAELEIARAEYIPTFFYLPALCSAFTTP